MVRLAGRRIDWLVLGDAAVAWRSVSGHAHGVTDDRLEQLTDAPVVVADVRRYDPAYVMKVRNQPGGFWVAAADPAAAAEALTGSLPTDEIGTVGLYSDGITRLVERYSYSWEQVFDLAARFGPRALVDAVREAEHADPAPDRWRGKRHDDATAIIATLTPTGGSPLVAAAVVTCRHGVLIGRRNEGSPLWTLIAGELEPGESPADAVVREVKEETGLQVTAAREIGRRVHPETGRTMIYVACRPTAERTDVHIGDEDELADVRWASLAEIEQLLPGLYEPVHHYLTHELG
jgi:8-oxo-dGTP pyrophosphatase MutT (NUDIX family)